MNNLLKDVINTATFKQSGITFVGFVLNGFLGALFYIVVARSLGPADFGLLTVTIVALTLIADVADIGTNTGLIRFVSVNLSSNKQKALQFLKLSLEVKLVVWLICLVAILLLAPIIALQIFHKTELTNPLRLVALGVGGALLYSFATSSLQAFQKYVWWSAINISTNFLRLGMALILIVFSQLDLNNSLVSFISLPFLGFFITLLILPTRQIITAKNELDLSQEFFKYNIWVAVFTIIAAFSARLDIFLNAAWLSARDVGIYGAANQLVQIVPQLVGALGVVAAPKFASFTDKKKMIVYLKKLQLLVTGLCLLGILVLPIVVYLIPIIYGPAYLKAITPFIYLFLAMLIFLFSVPVHNSVIFYYGRPDVFVWVSAGHLLIIGLLGYLLIPQLGILGTSLTVLVGTTFNFFAPLIWLLIKIKK